MGGVSHPNMWWNRSQQKKKKELQRWRKNQVSIKGIMKQEDIIVTNIPILQYNLKIQCNNCGKK